MKTFQRSLHGGQAVVEFAIVFPILFLIAIGAIDLLRGCYCFVEIESAAHAGAQYGCQNTNTASNITNITTVALTQTGDIANNNPQVAVTNNYASSNIWVTVSATFTPIIRWPGLPSQIPMKRTCVMRIMNNSQ